jgi:hypothetical protein
MISFLLLVLLQQGIAAQYPGDEGIEKDPRVVFVEDFETGDITDLASRWGNAASRNMAFVDEGHAATPGHRSLRIANNGHLFTHVRGADTMFARFYVKFHEKTGYLHHFVQLLADEPPTPWPKGGAGLKPDGDKKFTTELGPWGREGKVPAPGMLHFYSYWHEMKPDGHGDYWGKLFEEDHQDPIQPGRWYCLEFMLKANSRPDLSDGAHAFWVDGKKIAEFQGMRWRTTDSLKVNTFWLNYYITEFAAKSNHDTATDRVNEVLFDDIVIATEYIGPIVGQPKGGKKAAIPGQSTLNKPATPVPPGKVVFAQTFEKGGGAFKGDVQDGALSFGPKGTSAWNAWSVPVRPSTTVRLRLKPLAEVDSVTLMMWSDKLKDNVRLTIGGLRKGEWKQVDVRVMQARAGPAQDGATLEGSDVNNISLMFEGPSDARMLLGAFELCE